MRILLQRVKEAKVTVLEKITGQIGKGLLLFFGAHKDDTPEKTEYLANKIINLRIFPDENDKMNKEIKSFGGGILVVSQFTLYGDCTKGRRPEFTEAALPETAFMLYEKFNQELSALLEKPVQTGVFGAKMEVALINDGPVTFLLER